MTRSILGILFLCMVSVCALSSTAAAQTIQCGPRAFSCGQYSLLNMTCIPAVPLGATGCYGFLWTTYCWLPPLCAPAAAPSETGCNCGAGKPISLADGNTYIEETDVRIPGLSGGLKLTRQWNSIWPATMNAYQTGLFGPSWRSTFEEQVFLGGDNYVKYARGDGHFWSFTYNNGVYVSVAPANVSARLIAGSSYWTLAFQNGEQRLFDNVSGRLTAIVDRNGNATQLAYDGLGRLVTVTDPASRHLYFDYSGVSHLVSSVTSDFGMTISYSYDGQGRLSGVTEADGSTLSYQYDSNSYISAVLDANGKVLEAHTYDSSGRGLTSTRANGVDAVTVSY
jgi:YD repeat-containing protein